MTRLKPTPVVVSEFKQIDATLAEIAAIDRKLGEIEADMNFSIDEAKQQAKMKSEALNNQRKELADAVATYAMLNKQSLFEKAKSLVLSFGTIGFRQSTQIVQLPKWTQAMTLAKLHEFAFNDAIRTKEEINKDTLATYPDERLELVGLKRRVNDSFFIEINKEELV